MKSLKILLAGAAMFLASAGTSDAASITMKYAFQNPQSHPLAMAAQRFADLVKERSKGDIEITLFPGGTLGGVKESIQGVQMGLIDLVQTKPSQISDLGAKNFDVLSLPFIFRDTDHERAVLFGKIGDQLLSELKTVSLVGVGWYLDSPRHLFFRTKKVEKPSDMVGLKMRTLTGKVSVDLMKSFGSSAVPMPFGELFMALQSGVVDGADQPLSGFFAGRYQEVAKVVTLTAHDAAPTTVLISPRTWGKLNDAQKKIMIEAHAESAAFFEQTEMVQNAKIIKDLEAQGVTVIPVLDKDAWIKSMDGFYKEYGAKFKTLIDQIRATK